MDNMQYSHKISKHFSGCTCMIQINNIKTESRETDTVNVNNKSREKQNLSIKFFEFIQNTEKNSA